MWETFRKAECTPRWRAVLILIENAQNQDPGAGEKVRSALGCCPRANTLHTLSQEDEDIWPKSAVLQGGRSVSLVHHFGMSELVAMPDLGRPGGNPATGANIAGIGPGMPGGFCAEFDGDDSEYNLGDIVELNAVEAFTMAFWMNQNVLDVTDVIFEKELDSNNRITVFTSSSGDMYFDISLGGLSRGFFDYSTLISAGTWAHVVMVFDGSQVDNLARLVVYVDGDAVALSYNNSIPEVTYDLSGIDAMIGRNSSSFDGRLDTFMFFNTPLTHLMVSDLRIATSQGRL